MHQQAWLAVLLLIIVKIFSGGLCKVGIQSSCSGCILGWVWVNSVVWTFPTKSGIFLQLVFLGMSEVTTNGQLRACVLVQKLLLPTPDPWPLTLGELGFTVFPLRSHSLRFPHLGPYTLTPLPPGPGSSGPPARSLSCPSAQHKSMRPCVLNDNIICMLKELIYVFTTLLLLYMLNDFSNLVMSLFRSY